MAPCVSVPSVMSRVDDPGAVPCVTLYSYTAVREDELSFEAGQQLVGGAAAGRRGQRVLGSYCT